MDGIFEAYMNSDFAKDVLKKLAEEATYPKATPRYGAIFKVEKRPTGAHVQFYLRAGVVVTTPEKEELRGKGPIFQYLREKYPDLEDEKIHEVIQNIMMQPSTQKYIRKQTGRSPVLVYQTDLNLPQFKEMGGPELKGFLLTLLRKGVFDPILTTAKEKKEEDIAELASRLKEVEEGEIKFYPERTKEESTPVGIERFLPKVESSKKIVAEDSTWWYINEMDMMIEGPFPNLQATMDAQERKLGIEVTEEDIVPKELIPVEEELAMAANIKDTLQKLASISDKLDEKNEVESADALDRIIQTAADEYKIVMPYDAVKDFHPSGGSPDTKDGHGKVCPGDTRTETITEQQKVDLEVATKAPTGEQKTPTATASCKKCGLTHIAAAVGACPSCDAVLEK